MQGDLVVTSSQEEKSPQELEQQQWQEKKIEQPGSIVVASTKLLNVVMKVSVVSLEPSEMNLRK